MSSYIIHKLFQKAANTLDMQSFYKSVQAYEAKKYLENTIIRYLYGLEVDIGIDNLTVPIFFC